MTVPIPLPFTEGPDTAGFFEAAADGRLVVRQCDKCDEVLHLPRAYCAGCGSWEGHWRDVAPTGTLYSWSVAHRQLHPAFPAPYTTVLVALDDVPEVRLLGMLVGDVSLTAGMPMRARFDRYRETTVVGWEPAPT